MYIFNPYILSLVFLPWYCSPLYHAGFSAALQISRAEDCFLCLKNLLAEYLGYFSSLIPGVVSTSVILT